MLSVYVSLLTIYQNLLKSRAQQINFSKVEPTNLLKKGNLQVIVWESTNWDNSITILSFDRNFTTP